MAQRVEPTGNTGPRSRAPVFAAVAIAAVAIAAFAATGGLSYAADAVNGATHSVANTLSSSDNTAPSSQISPADAEYSAAGYYCIVKNKNYKEQYISNQSQYDAAVNAGYTITRYDDGTSQNCP